MSKSIEDRITSALLTFISILFVEYIISSKLQKYGFIEKADGFDSLDLYFLFFPAICGNYAFSVKDKSVSVLSKILCGFFAFLPMTLLIVIIGRIIIHFLFLPYEGNDLDHLIMICIGMIAFICFMNPEEKKESSSETYTYEISDDEEDDWDESDSYESYSSYSDSYRDRQREEEEERERQRRYDEQEEQRRQEAWEEHQRRQNEEAAERSRKEIEDRHHFGHG